MKVDMKRDPQETLSNVLISTEKSPVTFPGCDKNTSLGGDHILQIRFNFVPALRSNQRQLILPTHHATLLSKLTDG
jgi:hypothetical protein